MANDPRPDDAAPASPVTPAFFPVSLRKLAVLSFCTMGLYHLYWFYMHWRHVRVWNAGRDFSPARRTLLFFFFCFSLFRRVRAQDARVKVNGRSSLKAGLLALGYIAANLCDLLPGIWGLMSIFSFIFLLPVQAHANRVNELTCSAPFDRNASFSAWNWMAVVLGTLLVVLSVVAAIYEMGK
ncbi:DUF4234 domain-containing protein [Diaphorobacter caeni]|uniref:DUF4234 domain-containing protein n=1 Tax=Diaphorobacter caeni TaxID=2784387 RepID=UPI00188DE534|nr:DUF4234 domain-containing protein [Diaphorobacter caeni]MBF5004894.1 DUF4234 domain-containing protein [Diaphorobacter caeni]